MTPNPVLPVPPRNRRTLIIVGALFLLPFIGAYVLYYDLPQLHPQQRTNYGQLIDPARPLPALMLVDAQGAAARADALTGKWSLVYLGAANGCDEACEKRLLLFRQIRLALGKDLQRAQRVYLAPDAVGAAQVQAQLAKLHPDLHVYADTGVPGARAADFFHPVDANAIYAIDPLGNWFMVYAGSVDPKGVYGDLHMLLRLSSIG